MIKKDYKKIDESVDLSFVNNDLAYSSSLDLIIDIIVKSFMNALPNLVIVAGLTISLLTISHFSTTNTNNENFQLLEFNLLGIGFLYISIFGFYFAIGTLEPFDNVAYTLFTRQRGFAEIYEDTKKMVTIISFLVILPFCLVGYLILHFLFATELASNDIWRLYSEFIIYAPVFMLFMLLIHLNCKVLLIANLHKELFILGGIYFKLFGLGYLLFVIFLKMNLLGITLGLLCNTFFSYLLSQYLVRKYIEPLHEANYFAFIQQGRYFPKLNEFVRESLYSGLYQNLEYSAFAVTILATMYLSDYEFAANLIIFSLLALIRTLCYGLSTTFKAYVGIHSLQHSLLSKKKFLRNFTFIFLSLAIIFSVSLLTLQYNIPYLFLNSLTPHFNLVVSEVASVIRYYCVVIFIDYIAIVSDGFIAGGSPSLKLSLIKGLIKCFIFAPLGLLICYFFNYKLIGFYIAVYMYMIVHAVGNIFYIWENHDLWIIRT